jgi:hypothetical protein
MGAVVASFTKNGQVCQVLLRTAKKFYQLIRGHVLGERKRRLQPLPRWRIMEAKAGAFAYAQRSGRNYFAEKR